MARRAAALSTCTAFDVNPGRQHRAKDMCDMNCRGPSLAEFTWNVLE
jgi:hypothetical protein